ncbi:hypothetical protein [uncultured Mediterranean phage uvMED]|nr:hypothetical protein [uncultured Mediterranean phage uvMED]
MTATLQTLLGDLKRETENLNGFMKAQNERINGLHHATNNGATDRLAPEVLATLQLALHREGKLLLDETRERQASIDGIVWQIRNVCSLSIQETFKACKLAKKDITEVF